MIYTVGALGIYAVSKGVDFYIWCTISCRLLWATVTTCFFVFCSLCECLNSKALKHTWVYMKCCQPALSFITKDQMHILKNGVRTWNSLTALCISLLSRGSVPYLVVCLSFFPTSQLPAGIWIPVSLSHGWWQRQAENTGDAYDDGPVPTCSSPPFFFFLETPSDGDFRNRFSGKTFNWREFYFYILLRLHYCSGVRLET